MESVKQLITRGQDVSLEFTSHIENQLTITRTIVAFANTNGGKVIVGINEKNKVVGVEPAEDRVYVSGRGGCQLAHNHHGLAACSAVHVRHGSEESRALPWAARSRFLLRRLDLRWRRSPKRGRGHRNRPTVHMCEPLESTGKCSNSWLVP